MASSMIELTKKRLFAQKRNEKVKRRSVLAAGIVDGYVFLQEFKLRLIFIYYNILILSHRTSVLHT